MRGKYYILSIALSAVIIGVIIMVVTDQLRQRPIDDGPRSSLRAIVEQPFEKTTAHLYFADKDNNYLIAEQRALPHSDDPLIFGRALVQALIEGPQKGLMRTLPEATEIRALFMVADETLCLDLSETIRETHPGGSLTELLTIYSLVNTLVLNLPEIDRAKILIGGRETPTLAGHIDLQFPFNANMLLIR